MHDASAVNHGARLAFDVPNLARRLFSHSGLQSVSASSAFSQSHRLPTARADRHLLRFLHDFCNRKIFAALGNKGMPCAGSCCVAGPILPGTPPKERKKEPTEMTKLALSVAAMLLASSAAFAGSDHFGAEQCQPASRLPSTQMPPLRSPPLRARTASTPR